jgi:hypothetical protein
MRSEDAQVTETRSVIEDCQRELAYLREVLAEFRTSNEKSIQFLAAAWKTKERTELPNAE